MFSLSDDGYFKDRLIINLSSLLSDTPDPANEIAELLTENPFLQNLNRVSPSFYSKGNNRYCFGTRRLVQKHKDDLLFEYARIATLKILGNRPKSRGGTQVSLTFMDLLGEQANSFFEWANIQDDTVREKFLDYKLVDGPVYKTHNFDTYYSDFLVLFALIKVTQNYNPNIRFVLVFRNFKSRLLENRVFQNADLEKLIKTITRCSVMIINSSIRRKKTASSMGMFEDEYARSALTKLWADHLARSVSDVESAAERWRSLNSDSWKYRDGAGDAFVQSFEDLTPERVDELSGIERSDDVASTSTLPRPIRGVYEYKIESKGISRKNPDLSPLVSKDDLKAKHKLAATAFERTEKLVGGLENSWYRDFTRFAQPIGEALGDSLDECDPILIIGLHRPFARMLDAAQRDEADQDTSVSEFLPIDHIKRSHLEWMSEAISDLARAFEQNLAYEQDKRRHQEDGENLKEVQHEIEHLTRILNQDKNDPGADLYNLLDLEKRTVSQLPEVNHLILATTANLMLVVLDTVSKISRSTDLPSLPKTRIGWDKFREKLGANLADRIAGKYSATTVALLAALASWFGATSQTLVNAAPSLFEKLSTYFLSLFG